MSIRDGLFTSESVSVGHPDKVCDRIGDTVLDRFLSLDANARVACETLAADDKVLVASEFRTREQAHFDAVQDGAAKLVRETLCEVGYGTEAQDIDPERCAIEVRFNRQSEEIAAGIGEQESLGAGDPRLMFGCATPETPTLTSLAWKLATHLIERGTHLRGAGASPLRSDAKSQVTVRYADGVRIGVQAVGSPGSTCSASRLPRFAGIPSARSSMRWCRRDCGRRTSGCIATRRARGPSAARRAIRDSRARKIIVDTYGGACPHGGGAFSGKDPSKVDRSGAYAARWVAKHIVAAGLAARCTVQVVYAIGIAEPVSISVDTHDGDAASAGAIARAVRDVFNLSPTAIIRDLDLRRPIYAETAALGHFGPWRDPAIYRWERTDRAADLHRAFMAHGGRSLRTVESALQRAPFALGEH